MQNRREFHRNLTYLTGGMATCLSVNPLLAARFAVPDPAKPTNANRLITIFLKGGNDGLNTVVPATDPLYQRYRDDLRLDRGRSMSVGSDMYLAPALSDLAATWEAGRLRIQQGVGYANHSRSHFVSSAAWFEGRPTAVPPTFDGWLARAIDPLQRDTKSPLAYAIDSVETPELLRGRSTRVASLPSLSKVEAAELVELLSPPKPAASLSEAERFATQVCHNAVDALERVAAGHTQLDGFPNTSFGQAMRQVAQVVDTLPEVKAIHTTQGGYDTHSAQRQRHAGLLGNLAGGLRALDEFLHRRGLSDSTLILVFSEFGRRVQENKSQGTDHGAGGPL